MNFSGPLGNRVRPEFRPADDIGQERQDRPEYGLLSGPEASARQLGLNGKDPRGDPEYGLRGIDEKEIFHGKGGKIKRQAYFAGSRFEPVHLVGYETKNRKRQR
jgi:hypothetical protein